MNILILEDEIPAYKKLISHLEKVFSNDINHDWARSNKDGKTFLLENSYDFIISDIQLLDGISFDLYNDISVECPIIFCSAYDDYLFQAFDTNGIAYILKPYTQADFNKAIKKYQSLFENNNYNQLNTSTLTALKAALKNNDANYKSRFVIKKANGIQLLNVLDITLIQASGDFCIATDLNKKRHSISQNISTIQSQLNPKKFFKINRSEMVNINFIEHIESHFKNRLLITIKGIKDKVMTSSSNTAEFRKWLE